MKNIFALLFLISFLFGCEVKENQTALKLKNQEPTSLEVKKDSCEGILSSIEKRAYEKDIIHFNLSGVLNPEKHKSLYDNSRNLKLLEFNCLGLKDKIWKNFQYENNGEAFSPKRVYEISDTLHYYSEQEDGFMIIYNYGKINNIQYFTTIRPAGDGARNLLLFTISPQTQKIVDVIEIAYIFGDAGFNAEKQSKLLNDSILTQTHQFSGLIPTNNINAVSETYLKETSKFLISQAGEIKLLEHKVLINKELQ